MNAPHTFHPATATRMSPWEAQYRAALGSVNETWRLMQLYNELSQWGEPIAASVYDLANSTDPYERSEFMQAIEEQFLEWAAEEDNAAAAYAYEQRTRKPYDTEPVPMRTVLRRVGA